MKEPHKVIFWALKLGQSFLVLTINVQSPVIITCAHNV